MPPSKFTKLNLSELQRDAISKYAEYNWYLLREAIEKNYDELAKQVVGDMSYNPCFRNLVRSDILLERDKNKRMEKVEQAIDKWTDSVFSELKKRIDALPGAKGKCDIHMGPGTVLELQKIMNPEYGIFVTGGTVTTATGLYTLLDPYGLHGVIKPGPGELISMEAKRVGDFCPGILKQVSDDKEQASKAIDSARNMVKEAEARKGEVTGARETLQKAQRSMARLDYDAAVDFAQEAEKEASGAISRAEAPKKAPAPVAPPQAAPTPNEAGKSEIDGLIGKIEEAAMNLRHHNVDVVNIEVMVNTAREALQSGDLSVAKKMAGKAYTLVAEAMKEPEKPKPLPPSQRPGMQAFIRESGVVIVKTMPEHLMEIFEIPTEAEIKAKFGVKPVPTHFIETIKRLNILNEQYTGAYTNGDIAKRSEYAAKLRSTLRAFKDQIDSATSKQQMIFKAAVPGPAPKITIQPGTMPTSTVMDTMIRTILRIHDGVTRNEFIDILKRTYNISQEAAEATANRVMPALFKKV